MYSCKTWSSVTNPGDIYSHKYVKKHHQFQPSEQKVLMGRRQAETQSLLSWCRLTATNYL